MSEFKKNPRTRMSGILAHPSSFPSKYGIGDFGPTAYEFIDFLVSSGQTLWQSLPLGPTGFGDSPYQSFSAFAGQTLFISPDLLEEDGLLSEEDLLNPPAWFSDKTDYGKVMHYKGQLYRKAYQTFSVLEESSTLKSEYHNFCEEQRNWLFDYALYMALKEQQNNKPWLEWEEEYRNPSPETKTILQDELADAVSYQKFLQFLFYRQWFRLKEYANDHGIFIVGDIPIFVALDGSDVWANQSVFMLDEKGYPTDVAGVPPDYFSATGQLWGNPLYDWDKLKETGYKWWIDRIEHQLHLVDYLRIDHFRGFESFWAVPYGEETAVNGRWIAGPGKDFFYSLQETLGNDLPIFAEDLGVITPEVEDLRDTFHFPGMKILQFAFEDLNDNAFLPHNYPHNCVCYTGTHDNDTTCSWYRGISEECTKRLQLYCNSDGQEIAWDLIRLSMASPADYAIHPLTDVLSYRGEARMNMPGSASGNWCFRFPEDALTPELSSRLRKLTHLYGRC